MFGIGGFEFFVIILFGLLIFGPDKMPQLGRTIGRTMRQFNKVQDDMKRVITAEMYSKDPDKATSPFKPQDSILKKYEDEGAGEKVVGASASAAAVSTSVEAPASQADLLYGLAPSAQEHREPAQEISQGFESAPSSVSEPQGEASEEEER